VTAEQAARWEGHEDVPQIMRNAINAVLDGARTKNKDIQNFNDLHEHLIAHPEDDDFVCGLLEASGYLTVWDIEKEETPWEYDVDLLREFATAGSGIEEHCWSVLANEEAGPNRYIVNRGG
jgi:hypothetical protein